MTQEDKQLLLKDLCARLPYNVVIRCADNDTDYKCFLTTNILNELLYNIEYYDYKSYLRPMLSMTEEEKEELKSVTCPEGTGYFDEQYLICPMSHFGEHISYDFMSDIIDWLNAHHFDYRGLIEKGLALEAPMDIYKTKET